MNGKESRSAYYVSVSPSLVIAEVPPGLSGGSYALVVRTMPNGKDAREGRLEKPFVVV